MIDLNNIPMIDLSADPGAAHLLAGGMHCLVDGRKFVARFTCLSDENKPQIYLTEANSPGLTNRLDNEDDYCLNFRHVRDSESNPASRLGPAVMTVDRLVEVLTAKTYRIK